MLRKTIRAVVTVGACWLIFAYVDYGAIADAVGRADWAPVAAGLALILAIRLAMAYRWLVILKALGVESNIGSVLRVTLVSQSLGYLLPSSVGSDLVRVQQMRTSRAHLDRTTSSVLLDRLLGTASMLLVAAIAAIADAAGPDATGHGFAIAAAAFGALGCSAAAVAAWPPVWRILSARFRHGSAPPQAIAFIDRVTTALADRPLLRRVALPVATLSILVQVLRAAVFFLLFDAVGRPVEFVHCLIFVPIVFVLLTLPITIGGLGLREGSMAYFFSLVGVPAAASIAAGLLFYLLGLIVLVPGFAIFIRGSAGSRRSRASRRSSRPCSSRAFRP